MILEDIERRLKRLEFVAIVEHQLFIETGKAGQYKKAWKMVKRWNEQRVKLGLAEYW